MNGLDPKTYRPGNRQYQNTVFNLTGTLGRDAKDTEGDIEAAKEFARVILAGEQFKDMYTTELLEDVLARLKWATAIVGTAIDIKEARGDR